MSEAARTRKLLCFVMMPSGNRNEYEDGGIEESNFIYDAIIKPSLREVYNDSIEIIRQVDSLKPGAIDRDIVANIATADISIVDITGLNPNVFLELGMRYALRKNTTILIRQEGTDIPFDVATHRTVTYSTRYYGPDKAKTKLVAMLNEAREQGIGTADNLVYYVYPNLKVDLGTDLQGHGVMPWEYYWRHFADIAQRITVPQRTIFRPDVVIGISNGGMMFADLLVRSAFRGTPIWSLWADRNAQSNAEMFKTPPNDVLLDQIVKWLYGKSNKSPDFVAQQPNKLTILLVDDIVATGATSMEAFNYLTERLEGSQNIDICDVRFLPLFNKNPDSYERIRKFLIWVFPPFEYNREEIEKIHNTDYVKLPYLKDLR